MSRLGKVRVLVVDDEVHLLELYERCLRGSYEVVVESDPMRAVARLSSETFDLLLCDQRMPSMSGVELLERCRQLQPRIRRVIVSGFTDPHALVGAINSGHVERFLTKPVRPEVLLSCVDELTAGCVSDEGWLLVGNSLDIDRVAQTLRDRGESVEVARSVPSTVIASTVVLFDPEGPQAIADARITLGGRPGTVDRTLLTVHDRASKMAAAEALRAGAHDVVTTPIEADDLVMRAELWRFRSNERLETERLRMEIIAEKGFHDMVGASQCMRDLFADIARLAKSASTLLITGEPGVGKSLVARAIHRESRGQSFVHVPVLGRAPAELDEELLGSATDASQLPGNLPRAWRQAQGGTIVVDELTGLDLDQQRRLLELILAEGPERPLVLCITSGDLDEALANHRVLPELVERLRSVQLRVPALRERGDDIPRLACHFVAQHSRRLGRPTLEIGREALAELCAHEWPGNVSELESALERAVESNSGGVALQPGIVGADGGRPVMAKVVKNIIGGRDGLDRALAQLEAAVIAEALDRHKGNRSAAARLLKLPRQTLQDRMKKHGLWPS